MICPLAIDVVSIPAIMGVIRSPDSVAVWPFATCRWIGMYVTEPNIASPMAKLIAHAVANTRLRNSDGGSTGSVARCSTKTKASSST
jgi:hypothetical protein